MNRIFISAAHKSSGKTTVCIGVCAALRARGHTVQPSRRGPITSIRCGWGSRPAGLLQPGCVFDERERICDELRGARAVRSRVIEGNKGLYDGLDLDGSNSNAALATLIWRAGHSG